MNLREITPEEASRILNEHDDSVYVDVRTPSEFRAGRPRSAINIPVAFPDPASGRMQLNPEFLDVVQSVVPKDKDVILGCRSGQRSAAAQELLQQIGYERTANVAGGFSGKTDPTGQVLVEGWSTLGLPVERGDGGAGSYADLQNTTRR